VLYFAVPLSGEDVMRVTLAPFGTSSDVLPMLGLAKTLQSRGHVVTICAPEEFRSRIYNCEVPMFSSGRTYKEYLECEGEIEDATTALTSVLSRDMATHFVALRDGAREADILIGSRLQIAGPSLAEQHGIPYLYATTVPDVADHDRFPVFGVPHSEAQKRRSKRIKEWNTEVLSALNRERRFSNLPPVANFFEYLFRSGKILLLADPAFGSSKTLPNQVQTGFWFLESPIDLDPETETYLNQEKRPVYIAPFRLKNTRQIFELCTALSSAGHRVALGHGWENIEESELPSGTRFVKSLSYAQVFPRTSLIIHGGSPDIAMHAIRAKIPQIVAPYTVEQYYWADRCHAIGASPQPVLNSDLTNIRQLVEPLLADTSFTERMKRMQPENGTEAAASMIEKEVIGNQKSV
jgi:sterol 3beta-glucosyltransferase